MVLEYLTYLAVIAVLGAVLFTAAVLVLVTKEGASKLKEETSAKIPQIAAAPSADGLPDFRNFHHHGPVHSH